MLVYQRVPYLTIKHEMKKHHELGLCHEHPGDTKVPVFVVNRCARRTESWWKPAKSIMRLASSWLPDASNRGKHPGGVSIWLPSGDAPDTVLNSFNVQVLKFTKNSPGEARWWVDPKVGIRHGRPSTNGDWTCKIPGLVIWYIAIENGHLFREFSQLAWWFFHMFSIVISVNQTWQWEININKHAEWKIMGNVMNGDRFNPNLATVGWPICLQSPPLSILIGFWLG